MSNPYRPMSKTKRFFKRIEKFFVTCKQKFIVHYLITHGGKEIIEHYSNSTQQQAQVPIMPNSPIWTCWWQGEECMPDIVKACYNAMKLHGDRHPVILITKDNYKTYIDIPDYILDKQEKGIIDLTHFSDILRAMILSKHGGIWMDSTLLLPHKHIDDFFSPTHLFGVAITILFIIIFHKEVGLVSFGLAASLIFLPLSSLICILPTGNTTTNLLITCFWITHLPSDENMYLPFMK